jgi:hypothetical protein
MTRSNGDCMRRTFSNAGARLTRHVDAILRLDNVTDRMIADRANHAFGNYRYFPGRGRELFVEIRYTPSESL